MNIFLTGATGFLGKRLIKNLLTQDHHIYVLVRNKHKFHTLCQSLSSQQSTRLTAIYGDITKEKLGISDVDYERINEQIDAIYHMAALLSFDPADKDVTFNVNVDGTRNVLEFAKEIAAKKFFYVSTAYTLGKSEQGYEQLYSTDRSFVNYYEESKCVSEHLVFSYKEDFNVYIMRPAIIIGDSITGEADTSFALYGLLKGLKLLKRKISRKDNWTSNMYRLLINPSTQSNFVPVDYVADVLTIGLTYAQPNKIYNITNPHPLDHQVIFEIVKDVLQFPNLKMVATADEATFSKEEHFVNEPLKVFHSYWNRSIIFESQHTKEMLEEANRNELNMDEEMLRRIISSFVKERVHS
ncbi:SDR family oxidoreductase [Metabacillus iocasae]|uniref:Thioester reductase-like protein n=1 Tax=Priestia iocasae TaxID=2291674 RepID=A0ABS2QR18_9BACI|nr:SDR family oxidoreductase [Metabacillus iocasae]MBM7701191.1 thioester reductase-like protein [Metabacillus iocasae]